MPHPQSPALLNKTPTTSNGEKGLRRRTQRPRRVKIKSPRTSPSPDASKLQMRSGMNERKRRVAASTSQMLVNRRLNTLELPARERGRSGMNGDAQDAPPLLKNIKNVEERSGGRSSSVTKPGASHLRTEERSFGDAVLRKSTCLFSIHFRPSFLTHLSSNQHNC